MAPAVHVRGAGVGVDHPHQAHTKSQPHLCLFPYLSRRIVGGDDFCQQVRHYLGVVRSGLQRRRLLRREEGYVGGPYGIRVAFESDSNSPTFYATYCPGFGEVSQLSSQIDQYPAVLSFCWHGLVQHPRISSPRTPWLSRRNRSSAVRSCGLAVVISSPYLRARAAEVL